MKTKRCRLGLAALNGKLYAAGGYDSLNFLNTVERYCPIEDKWEFVAPMNFKRRFDIYLSTPDESKSGQSLSLYNYCYSMIKKRLSF